MSYPGFSPRHIPAIILATTSAFGGIWPMFNAEKAMLEFGFPRKVAQAPETRPVMVNGQARTTILGALAFIFYFQGKFVEVDTIMAVFGLYAGVVDSYLVWKGGGPQKAVFRLAASWFLGVCGVAGLTASTLP
ncbi:hypothetical protein QBC35DRAFT_489430 [Podospora australis]|uniref:Uncharacterized protein n=1 Tax=Podospora australis TaxID=1536484 RepID=A0AAN7AL37_9PEZI|nr:hypothetical protein QBC35DRAFT_489430 [Podospora australis]